ncbi:MAG: Amidophosphoribosyltransferase [Chlamydiae bacterium]|nr:Amidophosphoribosyltransferase [Chlamydiota bacterium]
MCGIIAIIDDQPVAEWIYQSMIQLQHRGQDAAGIFTYDPKTGKHFLHKNRGLVNQVLTPQTLPLSEASWGIGHVRYQTVGDGSIEDTQPMVMGNDPTIALGYNGNIVNYLPLRRELESKGCQFQSNCDAEVILHILSSHLSKGRCSFEDIQCAVKEVYRRVSGAYSVVATLTGIGMIAFRDPAGIRPLLYGTQKGSKAVGFASETYALIFCDFRNLQNIRPGEVMFVDKDFTPYRKQLINQSPSYCSFEFNYFAKPNTVIEHHEVYEIRSNLGKTLAQKVKASGFDIDVVVPVPNTARPAAISLARELDIPCEDGFVKQEYIGRTFIMPTQGLREKAISRKLGPVYSVFKDKNVLIIDDSIVRGTVSKKVTFLAKRAGAKKVYFASTFPPIRHPCLYGIDFANQDQLLAFGRTNEEIAKEIGVDGLIYNDIQEFVDVIGIKGLCLACVNGKYPTNTCGSEELQKMRQKDIQTVERTAISGV